MLPISPPPHKLRGRYERVRKLANELGKELRAIPTFRLEIAADKYASREAAGGDFEPFVGIKPQLIEWNGGHWVDFGYVQFVTRVLSDIVVLGKVAQLGARLAVNEDGGPISRYEFETPDPSPLVPPPTYKITPHVARLAGIYQRHSGQVARRSTTLEGGPDGPFIRFAEAVFEEVGVHYSKGTIAQALREARDLPWTKLLMEKS
jgi:hypothetical protein